MTGPEIRTAPSGAPSEPPLTDWVQRAFARVGLVSMFLLLLAGYMAASVFFRIAIADRASTLWGTPYLWLFDVLNGVLFAYIPSASRFLRQARLGDLRDLRPVLAGDATEFALLQEQTVSVAPLRLAAGGVLGALALGHLPMHDPALWVGPPPSLLAPEMIFLVLRHAALGWVSGHMVLTEMAATRAFSSIGREHVRVDILDLTPLAPFARGGARNAVTYMLMSLLVSLFWLGPAASSANGSIIGVMLVMVSISFFFSVVGLRQSIRRAKKEALDALVVQIRTTEARLAAGRPPGGGPSMADLVSFHSFVERVREWPMGGSTVLRGTLVAALAAGSWLGGALVERLVETALR